MIKFWRKTPYFIKYFFNKYIWSITTEKMELYLTFDDGPIPKVTEWVLDILLKENIKATFFCIGDNIRKHPEIFQRIINEGHTIGNHSFHHLNGWKNPTIKYIDDIEKTNEEIALRLKKNNLLFRPPYGKIKKKQAQRLFEKGYKIIMWDLLSYDFEPNLNLKKCLKILDKKVKPGSIIVFHDSIKAEKNLKKILPIAIKNWKKKGYNFSNNF